MSRRRPKGFCASDAARKHPCPGLLREQVACFCGFAGRFRHRGLRCAHAYAN
jgi:hypothetical protein